MFIFLILASLRALQQRQDVQLGMGIGLSAILRPEGFLVGAATLPFHGWRQRKWPGIPFFIASAFVLPDVLLLSWYYGSPIPQSLIALWHIWIPHGAWGRLYVFTLFVAQPPLALYGRLAWCLWHIQTWHSTAEATFQFSLAAVQVGLGVLAIRRLAGRDMSFAAAGVFILFLIAFFCIGDPIMNGWYDLPLQPLWISSLAYAWWKIIPTDFASRGLCALVLLMSQVLHLLWAGNPKTLWLLADHWDKGQERATERVCDILKAQG